MSLGCGMELAPDPDRRLTLTGEKDALGLPRLKLDMRIADSDFALYRKTLAEFGRQLLASRAGMLRLNFDHRGDWMKTMDWGNHHLGTTRMSNDPKAGRGRCRRQGAWRGKSPYRRQFGVSHLQRLQPHPESAGSDLAAGRPPEKGDGMKRRDFIAGVAAAGVALVAGFTASPTCS